MRILFILFLGMVLHCSVQPSHSNTLHVGVAQQYATVVAASKVAVAGDTIFIHAGEYRGTFFIENLHGTLQNTIVITGEMQAGANGTSFTGGSESLHLSDCSYITLENFNVTAQTGNGLNIDDAGTIESPAHNITVRNIHFFEMGATGNNDFLKLSGLDSFLIENCTFHLGSEGGSGIDMVGCHYGIIRKNEFSEMGSNSIQAKGGTQFVRIEQNFFYKGGQRTLNLGGSTGLDFFRPIDATFEAADIVVHANVIVGGTAAIGYVGCTRVDVSNNTIIYPEKWVARILQETVNPERFVECSNNIFRNNIVLFTNVVSTKFNIGPNTQPQTFLLASNVWHNSQDSLNSRWSDAQLTQLGSVFDLNPNFSDDTLEKWMPQNQRIMSAGNVVATLRQDFYGRTFAEQPAIGAVETNFGIESVENYQYSNTTPRLYSFAFTHQLVVTEEMLYKRVLAYDYNGKLILETTITSPGTHVVSTNVPTLLILY